MPRSARAFAFSRGCRTRFIYDYFAGGARGGAAPRCGVCDVCLGWRRGAGRPLDEDELLQVRIALSGVGRLSGRFGVERVAQVLVGGQGKEVLAGMFATGKTAAVIVDEKGLKQESDAGAIEAICQQVIDANPNPVAEYRAGNEKSINFLKGQVMKLSKGKANPQVVHEVLVKLL